MGTDRIRYLVYSKGRWRWQPTKAMRAYGFRTINLSQGGPEIDANSYPAASTDDKMKAVNMNAAWDAARLGLPAPQRAIEKLTVYPPGQRWRRLQARHGAAQSRQSGEGHCLDC
jgi:hypothetical protein